MKEFGKELVKIGGRAFVTGAAITLGFGIGERIMQKIKFKHDLKEVSKLLDQIDNTIKPKKKFGKR